MAKVTLICGMLCSGKSMLARKVCAQSGAVLLSCDELMLSLFPEDALGEMYETYAARAKEYLLLQTEKLVRADVDVVLDWGFWTRSEREYMARRFASAGIAVEWMQTLVDQNTWETYIESRNESVKNGSMKEYLIDEALRSKALARFEPLTEDELKLYARFS